MGVEGKREITLVCFLKIMETAFRWSTVIQYYTYAYIHIIFLSFSVTLFKHLPHPTCVCLVYSPTVL